MHREIEWASAAVFGLVGLSQIYLPGAWAAYHPRLVARGETGIRIYGMIVLSAGAAIAGLHNVWSGPAIVLTVTGWLLILEGGLCALAPALGVAGFAAADAVVRSRAIMATGIYSVVVSGVLWVHLLWVGPPPAG